MDDKILTVPGSARPLKFRFLAQRVWHNTPVAQAQWRCAILPAPERHAAYVQELTKDWPVKPVIVTGEAAKWEAFSKADAALAASGTVSLEQH